MASQLMSVKTSADWPYFVVANDKDPAVVVPLDLIPAGKHAEGRQQADGFSQPETRQSQALSTSAS